MGAGAFGWIYPGQYALESAGVHGTALCTLPGFTMGGKSIGHLVTPYYGSHSVRRYRRYRRRFPYDV